MFKPKKSENFYSELYGTKIVSFHGIYINFGRYRKELAYHYITKDVLSDLTIFNSKFSALPPCVARIFD